MTRSGPVSPYFDGITTITPGNYAAHPLCVIKHAGSLWADVAVLNQSEFQLPEP
jgi:hypothetical protein